MMMKSQWEDKISPLYIETCSFPPTKNRIIVAESWNVSPHLETGLEIALRLAVAGYRVDYFHYGNLLPMVECYSTRGKGLKERICGYQTPEARCIRNANLLASKLKLPFKAKRLCGYLSQNLDLNYSLTNKNLANLHSLSTTEWRGKSEFGISIASSLVSLTNESEVSPQKYNHLCDTLAKTFICSYYLGLQLASIKKYSLAVVFNGRHASIKGYCSSMAEMNIPIAYHERGGSKEKFYFRPFQSHDRLKFQEDIKKFWFSSSNVKDKNVIASNYFLKSRQGHDLAWLSFCKDYSDSKAEEIISEQVIKKYQQRICTYFGSTDSEFMSVSDVFARSKSEWSSQEEAVRSLISLTQSLDLFLIIRIHPNMENASEVERSKWNQLSFIDNHENLLIVPSGSRASSYYLMDASKVAITYGSSMGIESIFWGRPSILIGDSHYDEINASLYKATTTKELKRLLSNICNLEVNPETALPYGFYQSESGFPYELYTPENLFRGNFLGTNCMEYQKTLRHRILSRINKLMLLNRSTK